MLKYILVGLGAAVIGSGVTVLGVYIYMVKNNPYR